MKRCLFLLITTALLIVPGYAQAPTTSCAAGDEACKRKNMTVEQLQEYIRQKDLEIQKLQAEMELRARTGSSSTTQNAPAAQPGLVRCPADKPDCNPSDYDHNGEDAQPISSKFVLPKIEEFFVPLHTIASPAATLFGARKKQNREIQEYWQQRREALEQANNQCLGLQGDENIRQCLQDVRQTEARKSQTIADYDRQRVNQANFQAQYRQQIIQNLNNSWDTDTNNGPRNINCSSYNAAGSTNTSCYGY